MTRITKNSKTLSATVLAVVMAAYSGGDARASGTPLSPGELAALADALSSLPPDQQKAVYKLAKEKKASAAPTPTGSRPPALAVTVSGGGSPGKAADAGCKVTFGDSKPLDQNEEDARSAVQKAVANLKGKDCNDLKKNFNQQPTPEWEKHLAKDGIVFALGKDFADVGYLKLVPNTESAWGLASSGSSAGGSGSNAANGATLSYSDDRAANTSKLTLQAVGTVGAQFWAPPCPQNSTPQDSPVKCQTRTPSATDGQTVQSILPFIPDVAGFYRYGEAGAYGGVNKVTSSSTAGSAGTSTTSSTPASTTVTTLAPANANTLDYTLAGGYLILGLTDVGYTSTKANHTCIGPAAATDKDCEEVVVGTYFRFRAGELTDNLAQKTLGKIGKTQITEIDSATQFSGAVEFLPVWDFEPPRFLGQEWAVGKLVPLWLSPYGKVQWVPSVLFEYDEALDSSHIVQFSNLRRAERLGPQAIVVFKPFVYNDPNRDDSGEDDTSTPPNGPLGYLKSQLSKLSLNTTYHYWHEFQSKANAYALQENLTIPLFSNINFKIGYQRGMDENSGKNANLFTIGLSGQFCSTTCVSNSGSSGSSQDQQQ